MDGLLPATLNASCLPPASAGADVVRDAAERTGRHLGMLAELAEIGMELARDVRRQALAGDPPRDALPDPALVNRAGADGARADFGLMFARVARAVRQTVALEARLAADAQAREREGAVAQASRAAAERKRLKQQKERVRRLVEDAISADADAGDGEGLRLDLDERLEDPDIEDELGRGPIGVVVLGICKDLGVEFDLRHFSDAELGFDIPSAERGGAAGGGEFGFSGGAGVGANAAFGGALCSPLTLPSPPLAGGEGKKVAARCADAIVRPQWGGEKDCCASGACLPDLGGEADTGDPPSG